MLWDLDSDFTLKNSLFGGVKLVKNADSDKYVYSGYGIVFYTRIEVSFPDSNVGKNVIIFGGDMSLSVHIDKKGKDILILDKGATQGLNDTALTAETQYLINFTIPSLEFCVSLYYNGRNSFFFVDSTKIHQFKAKDSAIKKYSVSIGNISGGFSASYMKKNRIKWICVNDFYVDYRTFDTSNIIDIHKYLIKKHDMK